MKLTEAQRESRKKWRLANPEKMRQYRAKWSAAHPEYEAEKVRLWAIANPDKRRASWKRADAADPEATRARKLKWAAENPAKVKLATATHRRANPAKFNAYKAARLAAQIDATPPWSIGFFVDEIYAMASLRTRTSGVEHTVDHIVPLRSKLVCGLHVHTNLRVISRSMNSAKGNRHWPEMP